MSRHNQWAHFGQGWVSVEMVCHTQKPLLKVTALQQLIIGTSLPINRTVAPGLTQSMFLFNDVSILHTSYVVKRFSPMLPILG